MNTATEMTVPSLSDSSPILRGDSSDVINKVTGAFETTSSPKTEWFGTRGNTWILCSRWFPTMPGSFFQLFCAFLFLAFMGGGHNAFAATYIHALCACAFFSLSIFAGIDMCSPDVVVWGIILMVINIAQIVFISRKSKVISKVFDSDMQTIYHTRFAPFNITPEMFVELVTCKGCEMLKLEKGQKYAAEGKTPIEKVSMLTTGKMTVSVEGKYLHNVSGNDFLDSPEWESLKSSSAKSTYNVTITANVECRYISWRRKPLLSLLSKRRRMGKLITYMIGHDIVKKLYALNDRQFNPYGFRYDIRLPCVMSLRDDVAKREKKRHDAQSQPGTPSGRRHKKLGKTANAHYTKLFTRRMSERIMMLKDRKPPLQQSGTEQQ